MHGVLLTPLAQAADIVLPGASWVEKDASYVNGQGRLQAAARVIAPPGEALEDWQVFVNVGVALGAALSYTSSQEVRARHRGGGVGQPALCRTHEPGVRAPGVGAHWLQASNPSERWKWDFMFQDLPPVKFLGKARRDEFRRRCR